VNRMGRHRSRSQDRDRRSRSNERHKERRSYSRSPRRGRERERSRSPHAGRAGGSGGGSNIPRGRYFDGREAPKPCPCLGVFGMSLHTTERELKHIFGKYGEIESVQIVYDRFSSRSRGFGFVYFTSTKDATKAKENLTDAVIDGMRVRVDYSVTRGGGPYRHVFNSDASPSRDRNGGRRERRSRS